MTTPSAAGTADQFAEAWAAVNNPLTTATQIMSIAYEHPTLRAAVAAHPAAYPGLLDWLAGLGDPAVTAAVEARRAAPPPPPLPVPPPPAVVPAPSPAVADGPTSAPAAQPTDRLGSVSGPAYATPPDARPTETPSAIPALPAAGAGPEPTSPPATAYGAGPTAPTSAYTAAPSTPYATLPTGPSSASPNTSYATAPNPLYATPPETSYAAPANTPYATPPTGPYTAAPSTPYATLPTGAPGASAAPGLTGVAQAPGVRPASSDRGLLAGVGLGGGLLGALLFLATRGDFSSSGTFFFTLALVSGVTYSVGVAAALLIPRRWSGVAAGGMAAGVWLVVSWLAWAGDAYGGASILGFLTWQPFMIVAAGLLADIIVAKLAAGPQPLTPPRAGLAGLGVLAGCLGVGLFNYLLINPLTAAIGGYGYPGMVGNNLKYLFSESLLKVFLPATVIAYLVGLAAANLAPRLRPGALVGVPTSSPMAAIPSGLGQPSTPTGPGATPAKPGDPGTLDLPWYGIGLIDAYKRFFQKYGRFDGRASPGEYWWVVLANVIVGFTLSVLLSVAGMEASSSYFGSAYRLTGFGQFIMVLIVLFSLGTLVPGLAVCWRRLHDTGRSGSYYFMGLIPLVGGIIVLVALAGSPNPAGAQYDRPSNPGPLSTAPGYPPSMSS